MRFMLADAGRCLGWRLPILFALLILSGIFEGLGLTMLFPMLTKFGLGQGSEVGGVQSIIDAALAYCGVPNEIGPLLGVTTGVLFLQVAFQTGKSWMEADCQTRYTEYWHNRIFNAFIHANWAFFTGEKTATRINAIVAEAGRISAAFYLIVQIMAASVFMAVYATISLVSSWQMVAILVIFGFGIYLALRPMSRRGRLIGEQVGVVNEALQHRTMEFLGNAKLIKATATESLAISLFGKAAADYRLAFRLAGFHPKLIFGIYMVSGYVLLAGGLWLAVTQLNVNPATVLVSVYVFLRLYVQLTNLQQFRQGYLMSAPALATTMQQVNAAQAAEERLYEGVRLPEAPVRLEVRNLTVRYGDKAALDNVSFVVDPGTTLGISGASGAGKSTLVDVLVGLAAVSEGEVRVGDEVLRNVALADWRRSIGYVGQETLLLNGSVASNIAWGGHCRQDEIEAAARAANAHEFICRLPEGYETETGDRGVRLSGGQRQRIGLARALMGRKRLLILDEATSALDSESEHQIMTALAALRGSVTMLMVAHRLSTLRDADRILMFDNGRLAEMGNWAELIARDGAFARLWMLQQTVPAETSAPSAVGG